MGHCTSLRRLFGFALAGLLLAAVATFLFQARQKSVNAKAERILVEKGARRLTLFCAGRKLKEYRVALGFSPVGPKQREGDGRTPEGDRKSTRLNSSHVSISYAVFCLKKK